MTLVSSNINQWTVLAGMLPLVFAVSPHSNWLGRIAFDAQQTTEWWLTIAQSFAGLMLLSKMTMRRWEATLLFILWAMQFATSPLRPAIADPVRWTCTFAYAAWALAMLTFGSGTRPVFACLRQLRAELRASGQTRL
jgi:cation:H+ antiporter